MITQALAIGLLVGSALLAAVAVWVLVLAACTIRRPVPRPTRPRMLTSIYDLAYAYRRLRVAQHPGTTHESEEDHQCV